MDSMALAHASHAMLTSQENSVSSVMGTFGDPSAVIPVQQLVWREVSVMLGPMVLGPAPHVKGILEVTNVKAVLPLVSLAPTVTSSAQIHAWRMVFALMESTGTAYAFVGKEEQESIANSNQAPSKSLFISQFCSGASSRRFYPSDLE